MPKWGLGGDVARAYLGATNCGTSRGFAIEDFGLDCIENLARCDILFSSLRKYAAELLVEILVVVTAGEEEVIREKLSIWNDLPLTIIRCRRSGSSAASAVPASVWKTPVCSRFVQRSIHISPAEIRGRLVGRLSVPSRVECETPTANSSAAQPTLLDDCSVRVPSGIIARATQKFSKSDIRILRVAGSEQHPACELVKLS